MKKYLLGITTYNENQKIKRVIGKFNNYEVYDVLIVDDGSRDGSLEGITNKFPVLMIVNAQNRGAGYATRQVVDYAKGHGYDKVIFVSGNDKDSPDDVVKLTSVIEEGYDFVQGSRYLAGGVSGGMPFYRKIATRLIHPLLFSFFTGKKITDSTNGFRAMRLSILNDTRINLNQAWLDRYELEPYLFFKAVKLGFKVKEVPVTKIYPPKEEGYTKMKPVFGWWSILRPVLYLGLGIKK
jgi:dolichol-phosphate mannosyltransferase